MRTGMIIFGVIFLVIAALLYLVPMQQVGANTTTTGDGSVDTSTSSASLTIPAGWAYASAAIGFILLILGLAIPGSVKVIQGPRGPRGRGPVVHHRVPKRKTKRAALPVGTSVTTTTKIKR